MTVDAQAAWLADELPVSDLRRDDGTVTFTLSFYSHEWLTRFLLTHGRHVLALSEPELAADALAALDGDAAGSRSDNTAARA